MTTMISGADADELERLAATLRCAADELDGHARSVTATIRTVAWVGGVAVRFGSTWDRGHRPRIASTARYVRDAAAQLDRNAAEQRRASARHAGTPLSTGAVEAGDGAADRAEHGSLDRLGLLMTSLGVGHDVLDLLADHTLVLGGRGFDRVVDVLTDANFVALLRGLGEVVAIGDVVVHIVVDVVEHPSLPFDERIVHGLADAATRFGIDRGAEYAAEFLAQAATTALLPGLGAVLAPFVGQAAGAVAEVVVGELVDVIDDAADVVDVVADAAVDAYRAVASGFGLVVDAVGAVIDVAGAAVDLAGDVAGAFEGMLDGFDLHDLGLSDLVPFGGKP